MGKYSDVCGPYEIDTYKNFEDAKEACDIIRYDYIEDYIKRRKKISQTKFVY